MSIQFVHLSLFWATHAANCQRALPFIWHSLTVIWALFFQSIFPWDRDQTIPHSHQLRLLSLLSSNSCQALSHLHLRKVKSIKTHLTMHATSYYEHVQDKMKIVTHFLFQTIWSWHMSPYSSSSTAEPLSVIYKKTLKGRGGKKANWLGNLGLKTW